MDKELKELQDIKSLLVAQLLILGVKTTEIEEILQIGVGNFNKSFKMRKLNDRLKEENDAKKANQVEHR